MNERTTLADLDEAIEAEARRQAESYDAKAIRAKIAAEDARYAANPDLTEQRSVCENEDDEEEA